MNTATESAELFAADLECRCPICGVVNLTCYEMDELGIDYPRFTARDETIDVLGEPVAFGTACWDSAFGDECGSCLNVVLNTETALVGPNGYCHD